MFALVLASVWISFLYLVIEETSFEEMMIQVNRRILPKVTDKIAIGGNMITITCLSVMSVTKLRSMAAQLICIQEYISLNAKLKINVIRGPMMICYVKVVLLAIIMVGAYTSIMFGMMYDLKPLLELSALGTGINIGCLSINTIFNILPVFYFILVYIEVNLNLSTFWNI